MCRSMTLPISASRAPRLPRRSSGSRLVKQQQDAEHIIDAGRRWSSERLAHFLLEMLTRLQAVGSASEDSFVMPLSQEGIGDVIGLSAPHVNRMLAELKRNGSIVITGNELTILDRAALQILGEFHRTDPDAHPDPKTKALVLCGHCRAQGLDLLESAR